MPVGSVVRNAVHSDGITCSTKLAASSDPKATRPPIANAPASNATQATIASVGRSLAWPRRARITAKAPASTAADDAGARAVQNEDSQK